MIVIPSPIELSFLGKQRKDEDVENQKIKIQMGEIFFFCKNKGCNLLALFKASNIPQYPRVMTIVNEMKCIWVTKDGRCMVMPSMFSFISSMPV